MAELLGSLGSKPSKKEGSPSQSDLLHSVVAVSLTALLIQACASRKGERRSFSDYDELGRTGTAAGHNNIYLLEIARDGIAPLHAAARRGSQRKMNIDCQVEHGSTPLHYAVLGGQLDIVQYLINERGCDRMCRNKDGETPLHNACRTNNLDVVKYLIEDLKVDSSCRDKNDCTPLHIAAAFGTLSIVQYLVEEQQCDVECRNKNGNTPLHYAALGGQLDIVQYLISERGCDPMYRDEDGETPLHCACRTNNLDVVKYLIEDIKVDSSCRDRNDCTPLHYAALCGQLSVVKCLVEDYMCDPAVTDKNGLTPLQWAQRGDHITIVSNFSSIEKTVASECVHCCAVYDVFCLPPADLRRALVAQLKPYTRRATPTGTVLGSGTYGSVIELRSAGETVAGKIFKMSSTVRLQTIASRVCGELIMMTQLHHPNIVQCKGVSLLMNRHLPVLLMEQMMTSLHAYLLHPDNSNLPVKRKMSILLDTAIGLDYLHSHTPAIIHRDLTAKNVLLDSELMAKIADFGNSRIMDLDPESTPETLTSLPGTLEYMPPEAQGGRVI